MTKPYCLFFKNVALCVFYLQNIYRPHVCFCQTAVTAGIARIAFRLPQTGRCRCYVMACKCTSIFVFCKEKRRKHERLTLSEWRCSAQTHGLERKTAKMAHFGKVADIQKLTVF